MALKPYPTMMIPTVQMAINVAKSFGLIAFFSIMRDGRLSVVKCLGNRNRAENVCVHGYADKRGEYHTERIIVTENGFHPAFGNPVMDHRADSHADKDIREHFLKGGCNLISGIEQPILYGKIWRLYIHLAVVIADKISNLIFHVQVFYQRPAKDGDDKSQHYIGHGNLHAKDTGEKHKTPQIHHWR